MENTRFPRLNKSHSIKQNARPDGLPNFRNLGTLLRILLISSSMALLQAIILANTWYDMAQHTMQIAALLTPILLTSLLLLWIIQPWLNQLAYWHGAIAVTSLVVLLTLSIYSLDKEIYQPLDRIAGYFDVMRYCLLALVVCGVLLLYFRLRSKVLSRAMNDARLQALHARIRPHFLFNTINAVLGIVRTQPKLAETALEDMADLFRMAMSGTQDLVQLGQEIQLSKQYLALEKLRMGERLHVDWQIQNIPDDALIPPLLLQPLLENAVYHGIESLSQGGNIMIALRRNGDELHLKVENPYATRTDTQHPGNRIALRNIRERLDLLFDVEARYHVESGKDFYRVEIIFPYVSSVKEHLS